MKTKIAALVNYLAATLLMVMGIIYLTKTSFMSYHSDAISLKWSEVDQNTPGNPPIALTISGIVLLIIGFLLNRKAIHT